MKDSSGLGDVVLAVATFNSDDAVERLLDQVHAQGQPFGCIVVVDSGAESALPEVLVRRGWSDVEYVSLPDNPGSAGNLRHRCALALRGDQSAYVYVVNHDGLVDVTVVARLVEASLRDPAVGAAYPLRYNSIRGEYDLTGTRKGPGTFRGAGAPPDGPLLPAYWGSSNGALYATRALRQVLPWADLWMGWEDLELGLRLHSCGWKQFIVTSARVTDDYEYAARRVAGRELMISDKAAWYEYYSSRNLVLIGRRHLGDVAVAAASARRLLTNLGVVLLAREDRWHRLSLLSRGVAHGLLGRSGRWTPR